MNPKYLWPVGCIVTLAIGWSMGYMMGGTPGTGDHAASRVESPSRTSQHPEESARQKSPTATGAEEKEYMQTILGALRDPDYMRRQRDIYDAILKMPPDELPSAVALALKLPKKDRSQLLHSLVRRWAQIDPHAAANFALSLEPGQRQFFGTVAGAWADTDPRAAKEWVLSLPSSTDRTNALYYLTTSITNKDPEAALQFLLTLPASDLSRNGYSNYYQNVFSSWAAKDPTSASSRALALPPGQNRSNALQAVVQSWAQNDPQAAIAWAAQIPDYGPRRAALTSAYGSWAGDDMKAAAAAVLALPAGDERNRALAAVANNNSSFSGHSDPQTASTLVAQLPAGSARDNAVSNLARSWVRTDVAGALEWVAQLPDGKSKQAAQQQLAYSWMESDPRAAVEYFVKTKPPSGDEGNYAFSSIIGSWARNDSQQALEWTRQLGDPKTRGAALGGIINTIAEQDPQRAVALLAELPAASQANAVSNLASTWSRNDPDGAAAWVLQLPEGDTRKGAIGNIVSNMAQQDLAKTAGWLEKLPLGASRDAAVSTFASSAVNTDPESAAAWAATISDESKRNSQIQNIAYSWLRNDKDAATRWITQSTLLDDKTKQRLLPKR